MSPALVLLLRSRQHDGPEWPRYREGARKDERRWVQSLSDRELAQLCAGLGQVDKAVKGYRGPHPVALDRLVDYGDLW